MPAPNTSSPASSITDTGIREVDALLGDTKWGATAGAAAVTYSFPWASSASAVFSGTSGDSYSDIGEPGAYEVFGLDAVQQAAATAALQAWANVANISFRKVEDTPSTVGDIRFAFTSVSEIQRYWGWAYEPNSTWPAGGDIWINSDYGYDTDWDMGGSNFESLLHEIGHAIGLKHPFEGTTTLPSAQDNNLYTVMSYTNYEKGTYPNAGEINGKYTWITYSIYPETPMMLDIQAVQAIYGANTAYNAGDTTYTISADTPFFKTIWDGAGTDTLDCSGFTTDCVIDLAAGAYSSLRFLPAADTGGATVTYDGTNNLGIAYGCDIENVLAGSGDDTLSGNALANRLSGGSGSDLINGGAGEDTAVFQGPLGNYRITLNGGTGTVTDSSNSHNGTDTLQSIEHLRFSNLDINTTLKALSASLSATTVARVMELYVAFFNRTPDADGLAYWLTQSKNGMSINTMADLFYSAGVAASSLTGYSASMSSSDFVNVVYRNVLGRQEGADAEGLAYWKNLLDTGQATRGSLVSTILDSAHSFKGNSTYGWVADLLDNKIVVATQVAVDWGVNYLSTADAISYGMSIASAVTATDTSAAIAVVGIPAGALTLG